MKFSKIDLAQLAANATFQHLAEYPIIKNSRVMWLIYDDSDLLLCVGGLYFFSEISDVPTVWMEPSPFLRPIHYRQLIKAFNVLKEHHDQFTAIVDERKPEAVRLAKHLNFIHIEKGIFSCQV